MGMLLRRHDRKADRTPKVNGKPVKQEPKKKNLTNQEKPVTDERVRPLQYRN